MTQWICFKDSEGTIFTRQVTPDFSMFTKANEDEGTLYIALGFAGMLFADEISVDDPVDLETHILEQLTSGEFVDLVEYNFELMSDNE